MKYWLDTEFIEDGHTIDLISIGIICEDGRTLYLLNVDCDWPRANPFVLENVIPNLPPRPNPASILTSEQLAQGWRFKDDIADEVMEFLGADWTYVPGEQRSFEDHTHVRKLKEGNPKPEIWAYFGSYDWVALCQLFGKMIDLPKGFPMYINDIKQFANSKGNPTLPKDYGTLHNALDDAIWAMKAWEKLSELPYVV